MSNWLQCKCVSNEIHYTCSDKIKCNIPLMVAKSENKCEWKRDVHIVRMSDAKIVCRNEIRRKQNVLTIRRVFNSSNIAKCSSGRCVLRAAHTNASLWLAQRRDELLLDCHHLRFIVWVGFQCNSVNRKNRPQRILNRHAENRRFKNITKPGKKFNILCVYDKVVISKKKTISANGPQKRWNIFHLNMS